MNYQKLIMKFINSLKKQEKNNQIIIYNAGSGETKSIGKMQKMGLLHKMGESKMTCYETNF